MHYCAERSLLCYLSLSILEKSVVYEAVETGIINIADVLEKVENMKNKEILEQHEQFCNIWQASDGRYKTKLPDESKPNGKKLIAKTSKEDLENFIVKWYRDKQEKKENPRTMKALYQEWLAYKANDTSKANANKLQWTWNKYYLDSDIVTLNLEIIDVITIKTWFLKTIEKHQLSNRQYKELKSVANMIFDYAVEKRIVTTNVARNVHGISSKKFTESRKKEPAEQVYMNDEVRLIIQQAESQYAKTHNTAYLAVCLNFSLGLRVGEIVALQAEDFSESNVKICKQEVKNYYADETGKLHREGYGVVPYTKTESGMRSLYLSVYSKKYLSMILKHNKDNGFNSNYLFLDKNGNRIHDYAVNNVPRRLNKQIDTMQKGNHSIRKTVISEMLKSNSLTTVEVRNYAGHKDFTTTERYYHHPTVSMEKRATAYENAFSYIEKV